VPTVCADPDGYFYWDGYHPTEATGKIISQMVLKAIGR